MMKPLLAVGLFLSFSTQVSLAQETLRIPGVSKRYDLTVQMQGHYKKERIGTDTTCTGAAKVRLFRKGAKSPFQVLKLDAIEIHSDQTAYDPKTNKNLRKLYDDEYSVIFDDFNFDGQDDLAICNGRNGGYGGPSYEVYLYNPGRGRFVRSAGLSRLARGVYLGLFFPDAGRKQLVAFWKSGCCFHQTEKYRVVNNRPVLAEEITEDATGALMITTTRRRIKGRWVKWIAKEKIVEDEPKAP